MKPNVSTYREAERRLWDSFALQPTEEWIELESLGATIRVQEVGEGPPVVLVHGASNAGASWVNLVQHLDGFRCLVLDRPGCGLSDPLPVDAGKDAVDMVKRLGDQMIPDLLDALGLPQAHVLGNSYGGFFALRAAAAAPGRIARLVLYSWSLGIPMERTPAVMRFAAIPGIGQMTARLPIGRTGARAILRQVGLKGAIDSGNFTRGMLDWYVALLRHTPTMLNEIRSIPKVVTPIRGINASMLFTDELLANISSPVLCFWGEDDPNGGADTATRFVGRLLNGTLELVPAAGHAPWIDDIARATDSTRTFLLS